MSKLSDEEIAALREVALIVPSLKALVKQYEGAQAVNEWLARSNRFAVGFMKFALLVSSFVAGGYVALKKLVEWLR